MGVEFAGMVIHVPDFEIQIYMCWLWKVQVIVDIYPWSLKRRYNNRKLEVAFELIVIFKKEKKIQKQLFIPKWLPYALSRRIKKKKNGNA